MVRLDPVVEALLTTDPAKIHRMPDYRPRRLTRLDLARIELDRMIANGPKPWSLVSVELMAKGFGERTINLLRKQGGFHFGRLHGPDSEPSVWPIWHHPPSECDENGVPILHAYEVAPHIWVAWCRYCDRWHEHGSGEGYRAAHCHDNQKYTTYRLRYAGRLDVNRPYAAEGRWPRDRHAGSRRR